MQQLSYVTTLDCRQKAGKSSWIPGVRSNRRKIVHTGNTRIVTAMKQFIIKMLGKVVAIMFTGCEAYGVFMFEGRTN